jgi:hypothetical protein
MKMKTFVIAAAGVAIAAGFAGCRVRVDKDANGKDKTVQVDTPFGGVHVNTDQISASDLGLPVYPGAQQVRDNDKNKSADVHMGFGEWQLHVRAISYETSDPQDKVVAFYKKAMGRFGNVLTCQDNSAVGTPSVTAGGLSCSDSGNGRQHFNYDGNDYGGKNNNGLQLKAGSKRHQHILGFEHPENGQTRFALVSLDLPDMGKDSDNSD